MCDPATIGLIISAVGGVASTAQNAAVANRQGIEATRGLRAQSENQRRADVRVNQQIEELAASTGAEERAASLEDFQGALRASRGATEGALDPVSGASERFAESVSAGRGELETAGSEKAQRLSIIDGILRQRINEGQDIGRTATDLNAIGGDIAGQDFLTRMNISGQRPNLGVDLLAGLAQGVGAGMSQIPGETPTPSIPAAGPARPAGPFGAP